MKILHLSTSDFDGGAARAAYRLHQGLVNFGVDSKMLVRSKLGKDSSVISTKTLVSQLGSKADNLPLSQYPKREHNMFSLQWFPDLLVDRIRQINPDIIHLHWTCDGFLRIESLAKFQKPIVWTLHDMWAFTGGCHYTKGCDHYTKSCGSCPQLSSTRFRDLSHWTWQRKAKAWRSLNLTLVSPSRWLAQCASASPLFKDSRIEVIPNGIDIQRYKPIDKQVAREILGLPTDKQLVLFGAGSTSGDPRKGFQYLLSALQQSNLSKLKSKLELVIFGESGSANVLPSAFKAHYLGRLHDDVSLTLAYSSADVFVAPSKQDNLPNTVVEALACGTPCLAFDIGGMPDMIEHQYNGYLAQHFDVADMAKGMEWILGDRERHILLSKNAVRKTQEAFCLNNQAKHLLTLYGSI